MVARHIVSVEYNFPHPPSLLFSYIAAHENQSEIFLVKVERLKDGAVNRDGVGSERKIRSPPLPAFEETVTRFEPYNLIEYRMKPSWLSPIRDHLGRIVFTPSGGGTHLLYTISFVSKIPLAGGTLRKMTEHNLRDGLDRLMNKTSL